MTDLLKRLDEANALGFGLCGEAAIALRKTQGDVKYLRERHTESRADKLAAAYATLVSRIRELRDLAVDLSYYGSPDVDVDPLTIADSFRDKLDAIPLDPEDVGATIVADASRCTALSSEVRELTDRLAEVGGLGAKSLLELPIIIDSINYQTGPGPISAQVVLRGTGRGAMYLIRLHENLAKVLR